jgi:hypothetical protein
MLRRRTLESRRRPLEAFLARWLPTVIAHVGARTVAELLAGRESRFAAMRLEAMAEEDGEAVILPPPQPTVLDSIAVAQVAAHVRHFLTPTQVRSYKAHHVGMLFDALRARSRAWES